MMNSIEQAVDFLGHNLGELDDEAPINPTYKKLKKKMASDLNRLLKTIYRLERGAHQGDHDRGILLPDLGCEFPDEEEAD